MAGIRQLLYMLSMVAIAEGTSWLQQAPRIRNVDVAIIGGGASGMYAATRLHQHNRSVVVVEQQNRTGGHVATYIDPTSNKAIDVGVLYYHNISVVTDFAAYVGVPLEPVSLLSSNKQIYVDFSTGEVLPQATIAALGEMAPAFIKYYQLLSQYAYLQSGFHLPSPVPEDLFTPWKDFVAKYDLQGLAYTFDSFNQGWVNILDMPTLYVLKGFGQLLLQSFISGYEVRTAIHNNQQLFDAAAAKLGPEAVLSSSIVRRVHRSDNGVVLLIETPEGLRIIKAAKLLVTTPPLPEALGRMIEFDTLEGDLFDQFSCGYYWNAIVSGSGLPNDVSLYAAGANNDYYIADQPGLLTVIPSGEPGLQRAYFGSPASMTDEEVRRGILDALHRSAASIGYDTGNASVPFLRNHAPYHCTVTAEQIKGGFYDRLQALQGRSSTWYTGAAFQAHDSGSIWLFTENEILPQLLA